MPQMRGGRREMTRGPRTAPAEAAVAGVLGTRDGDSRRHGRRPSGDSRAPGGRPRDQGGDADRARHDPGEGSGVSARRKSVPGRLGSGLRGSTLAASSQGRPREGRIPGTAAAAPGGRGGGGGRLAPRPGERPGGPGLSPPPPPPLGAGGTRSGCARRGRKLSDLGGKHHNKRPSSAGARPPQRPPASAGPRQPPRLPPTRRPLPPRTGCGDLKPGRHDRSRCPGPAATSAYLASAGRHSDSD